MGNNENDTATHGTREVAADLAGMLELLESLIRPMRVRGKGPAPGGENTGLVGLIGNATLRDPNQTPEFWHQLSELMIAYDVDCVDATWSIPQVVKRMAHGGPRRPVADDAADGELV